MNHITNFHILALEPDPGRAQNLKRLIRRRVDAQVTVAPSSSSAIALLGDRVPDLVLTSVLAADDEQLLSHLNQLAHAREVPVLTVPPVAYLESPRQSARVPFGFLTRRSTSSVLPYDPEAVAERIADAVAGARAKGRTRAATPHWNQGEGRPIVAGALEIARSVKPADGSVHSLLARPKRGKQDRAQRWVPSDVPWFGGVQTPWGLSLDLLNISTTGLLVESPSKFMPGSFSELHLMGSGRSIIVPARLVRSEVSEVNSRGVKYQTAAVFDRRLDLILEQLHGLPRTEFAMPKVLVDLLRRATTDATPGRSLDAQALFEEGLCQLVRAREIRIRPAPTAPETGESVYFTVPVQNGSQPVLQVTFESDYEPQEEELSLLKAAAMVAASVLKNNALVVSSHNAW